MCVSRPTALHRRRISHLSRMFCRRMSPVDKDTISYFLTSLEDRVPLPAPGFPNMTILNTFPSLPAFPDSSLVLAALRKRLREETVEGGDFATLNSVGPRCLGDNCSGDISMGKGEEWREETVGEMRSRPAASYTCTGEHLWGLGHRVEQAGRLPPNTLPTSSDHSELSIVFLLGGSALQCAYSGEALRQPISSLISRTPYTPLISSLSTSTAAAIVSPT